MNLKALRAPGNDGLLLQALRRGTTPLAFAAVFSLVSNLLFLAMPIFTYQVYGRVLSSQSQETLLVLTLGALFVFVIVGLIDDYRGRVLIGLGEVFDRQVAPHVFTTLFDGVLKGQGQARAQALRDLDTFRQTVTGTAVAVLFDLPWIPLFLGVLWFIDPLVGFATTLGGMVLFGLALAQDRATRRPLHEANEAALKSYAFTDAALRNSEVVRAMGMLGALGREWAKHRAVMMERSSAASERASLLTNAIKSVRMGVQILIVALSAWLVIRQVMHPAMLFANMILSSRALAPIDRIVSSWTALFNGFEAYDRLDRMMREYVPPTVRTVLPRPEGRITVERVSYAPPGAGRLVLQNLNFQIGAGETVGIIGPSGAGKSTLARMLIGITPPAPGGVVRLDGADVYNWDREAFGRFVGYLPQDTELFAGSVRDNIARFRSDASDEEIVAAALAANVHELILRLPKGYDTDLGEGAVMLSVGQRQRVGLARALFDSPALVVLDEPNASLDAEGEAALFKALEALKARGATVILVAHKPSIFRTADKLIVLKDGRMEMYGPRDQVMARLAQPQGAPPIRAVENG